MRAAAKLLLPPNLLLLLLLLPQDLPQVSAYRKEQVHEEPAWQLSGGL